MPRLARDVPTACSSARRPATSTGRSRAVTSTGSRSRTGPTSTRGRSGSTAQLTNAPWYGTWWTNTRQALQDRQRQRRAQAGRHAALAVVGDALRPLGRPQGRDDPALRPDEQPADGRDPRHLAEVRGPAGAGRTTCTAAPRTRRSSPSRWRPTSTCTPTTASTSTDGLNAIEKAKAHGVLGLGYDDSVNHEVFRDFIDAHRARHRRSGRGRQHDPVDQHGVREGLHLGAPGDRRRHRRRHRGRRGLGRDEQRQRPGQGVRSRTTRVQPATRRRSAVAAGAVAADAGDRRRASATRSSTRPRTTSASRTRTTGRTGSTSAPRVRPTPASGSATGTAWAGCTTSRPRRRPTRCPTGPTRSRTRTTSSAATSPSTSSARRTRCATGLKQQVEAGRTTPTAAWKADYAAMKEWRVAGGRALPRRRLPARGVRRAQRLARGPRRSRRPPARTVQPKLLEAGQVFYFAVNPQSDRRITY